MKIANDYPILRHLVGVFTLAHFCMAEANSFKGSRTAVVCKKIFAINTTRSDDVDDRLLRRDARIRALQSFEIPEIATLTAELQQVRASNIANNSGSHSRHIVFNDPPRERGLVERYPISNSESYVNGSDVFSTTYYEKTIYQRGPFLIERHEIKVHSGLPKQVLNELKRISLANGWSSDELEQRIFNEFSKNGHLRDMNNEYLWQAMGKVNLAGKLRHDMALSEILNFSVTQYQRRTWDSDFIGKLIPNAYSALPKTNYVVVREIINNNLPGEIVTSIGYTRSTYKQIRYFNLKTNRWEERLSDLDTRFLPSKSSSLGTEDTGYTTNLEVLPMEKFYGPNFELPRPGLVNYIYDGKSELPSLLEDALKNYMNADMTKPIVIYTGQIFEPVKFAIAKGSGVRQVSYPAILLELFSGIFSADHPSQFNTQAQSLYTYNTAEGVALYKGMGFEVMGPQATHVDENGNQWFGLKLSPQRLIEAISNPKILNGRVAEDFAIEFEAAIERILSAQKH